MEFERIFFGELSYRFRWPEFRSNFGSLMRHMSLNFDGDRRTFPESRTDADKILFLLSDISLSSSFQSYFSKPKIEWEESHWLFDRKITLLEKLRFIKAWLWVNRRWVMWEFSDPTLTCSAERLWLKREMIFLSNLSWFSVEYNFWSRCLSP